MMNRLKSVANMFFNYIKYYINLLFWSAVSGPLNSVSVFKSFMLRPRECFAERCYFGRTGK